MKHLESFGTPWRSCQPIHILQLWLDTIGSGGGWGWGAAQTRADVTPVGTSWRRLKDLQDSGLSAVTCSAWLALAKSCSSTGSHTFTFPHCYPSWPLLWNSSFRKSSGASVELPLQIEFRGWSSLTIPAHCSGKLQCRKEWPALLSSAFSSAP